MKDSCPYKAVGRRMREARFLLGDKTQAEFGKQIGDFTAGQIGQVERGRSLPTGELLTALAKQGINVNYILTGEGTWRLSGMVRLEHPISQEELEEVLKTLERYRETLQGLHGVLIPQPPDVIQEVRRKMEKGQRKWENPDEE